LEDGFGRAAGLVGDLVDVADDYITGVLPGGEARGRGLRQV
jgi:hypothetical protein